MIGSKFLKWRLSLLVIKIMWPSELEPIKYPVLSRLRPKRVWLRGMVTMASYLWNWRCSITLAVTMSFVFSISDFESIARYSWKIYIACKGASSDFEEISREALSLHAILKELGDAVGDPTSLINRVADSKKQEILQSIRNCRMTLGTLENLVEKYHSLGTDKERKWDIIRFGTEALEPVRSKLMLSVANLTLFLSSLETSSLARIESLLEKLIGEVRSGRKAPTVLSFVLDDTSVGWPQLKNELTSEGIPRATVEMYKGSIQDWIREANDEGLFDDPDPEVTSSKSIHLRPLSVRRYSTLLAGSEEEEKPKAVSRVSTRSESQRAPVIVETQDGHVDDMGIGEITFSRPVELRPLSVRALSRSSTDSKEESSPSTSSTESKGARALSPMITETDLGIATTKTTPSDSTPLHEDMPSTAQSKPLVPSTASHYKNSSTSMEPDEHAMRATTEGYLAVPAISATPADSTEEVPFDTPGDVSINTEKTLKSSLIVDYNTTSDSLPTPTASFRSCCGNRQCCKDDVLNDVNPVPTRPGVI